MGNAMKCILMGGSGQVGGAVARELVASDVCARLTMLGRREVPDMQGRKNVEQLVVDTAADDFEDVVRKAAAGHDVGISCLGIGHGTLFMDAADMTAVEVTLAGRFARGCRAAGIELFLLLTAFGVDERDAHSKIKAFRSMGGKHRAVLDAGFPHLAVFRPGVIVGNVHTPPWMSFVTRIIPPSFGLSNIHQDEVARAFVAHLEKRSTLGAESCVVYGNREMRDLIRE
jgi:uncharacterized protein YbjT (DUF2867 family)